MNRVKNVSILLLLIAVMVPMATSQQKTVVIGLDGASKGLMDKCLENNNYENIESLKAEGSFKKMESPLPPLTPVSMSSFLTGKNPGGTGVYGFEERDTFSYDTSIVNSRDLETIFPEKIDGKSVMINVPMTYPAPELNGVVVSGFPGSTSGRYAHPPTVKKKLDEINYSVSTASNFDSQADLENKVFEIFEKRRDLSLDLMDKYSWKFFMVMFTGDARLQHFSSSDGCEESLGEYYSGLDSFIGEVDEKTGDNTTIVLMSNHGFRELDKKIYLYSFLKQNGYLEPEKPDYYWHWFQDTAGDILSSIGLSSEGEISSRGEMSSKYMEELNWNKTMAYTGSFYNGQIFLNVKGREPNGVVEPENYEEVRQNIVEDLKELRDPETGERVAKNIYTKDEIYSGDEEQDVPDIVIESPGYNHIARFGFGDTFLKNPAESSSPVKEGFVMSNREISGDDIDIIDLSSSITGQLGLEFGEGENIFRE